jgi:hypothetical protein
VLIPWRLARIGPWDAVAAADFQSAESRRPAQSPTVSVSAAGGPTSDDDVRKWRTTRMTAAPTEVSCAR